MALLITVMSTVMLFCKYPWNIYIQYVCAVIKKIMGVALFCKRILQNLKVVDTVSRIDIFANELFSYKLVGHCSGNKILWSFAHPAFNTICLSNIKFFLSNICILYWEQMMQCLTYAGMYREGPIQHFCILENQHFFELGFVPIILVHVRYLLYPFFLCCCHQHAFEVLCNISRRTKQYHV